jgi:hypothetical protein
LNSSSHAGEAMLIDWHAKGETVALCRTGIGLSLAFTGKLLRAPMGVWSVGGRSAGTFFDVARATCRVGELWVPRVFQDLLGTTAMAGIDLLLDSGEQVTLWKVEGSAFSAGQSSAPEA